MKNLTVIHISRFEDDFEPGKWYDDLIMCPSQCYCAVFDRAGAPHILYLRWRWNDPWQARIIKCAHNESAMVTDSAEWSFDVFESAGLFFREEELDEAKEALLEIWNKSK